MSDSPKANLLIVDDDLNGLRAMKRLLGGTDRKVTAVSSGQDALRAVLNTEFALIVLDIRMPEMNGFETAALIRKRRQSRHTPIIFLTAAFDDIDSVFRGYQVGAVDYLLKPVDPDILRAKAAVFIELYQKRAELAGEVAQRQRAEAELARVNAGLEAKIRERTASLVAANEQLKHEIESRKRIEEELRAATVAAQAANVAKSTFLANMSHEIRTPMSAIIGMTDVTLRTDLTAEQRQYLGLAKAASESLLRVINDILDFSKIEAGKLEIESIPFSLRESLSQSMKTLAVQAHEKGIELAYEVAPDTPDALIGDPIRLRQVVSNLTSNAIKFTEHGEIVIRVRSDTTDDAAVACHFTVTDTGIGIPADKQAEIFAPFQQADSSTTRLYGGTGLGLAIAARLVALMNGKVWVDSAPGRGSTFHFTVLLQRQTGPELLREGFDFSSVRALVVEDHPVHRQVMVEMLRQWKVDVREAASGAAAREMLRDAPKAKEPLHVVLLDESLPDTDSVALAREMLADEGSTPRVVMLLASSPPTPAEAAELPERVYRLAKPITQTELLHVLEAGSGEAPAVESAEPPVASRSPMRVLLVEDNVINRRLAQIVLEREGHKVVAVEDGAAALEALSKLAFDVVLMDLQMPHMDGLQTTIAIRNREQLTGEHVPIIALTAHAMAGDRERCLQAGMDGYLTKPVDEARLLKAIGLSPPPVNAPTPLPTRKVVLDRNALVERVDGDPQLLEEIIELYFGNYGRLMADAKRAMTTRNGEGFRDALHTLAGMFQNLAARSAQDLIEMLRAMDLAREPERADMIWVMLDQEVQALNAELSSLLYERTATGTNDR